ncbi:MULTISPECIES: hypothetical protein [Tsukamurella]|uniref:Uncharacterized protein n=2 Tax=Tsukamurella TaxID=2060 RepID=A0A5C5S586_9ACTN|nr:MULTISPECIES: hypothetical protein [Tsukamurella]NMD55223.1 hypothetical protein [Tsukamurella columbiensis]TWS30244.1 hypothetical protein FK530_06980 [Tsukamurella conjunctivitidis]
MQHQNTNPGANGTPSTPPSGSPPATHTTEVVVLACIAFAVVYLLAQLLRAYPTVVGAAVALGAIGFGAWGMSVHRTGPHNRDGAGR